MKRTLRLVGTAAMVLLLAVSCKKDEKNNNGEKQMMTFSAGIEQGNSKIGLVDGSGDNVYEQVWKKGDVINVNGNPFTLKDESDGMSYGEFSGYGAEASKYYAAYYGTVSGQSATYTLPDVQYYNDKDYPLDAPAALGGKPIAPMYAISTDKTSLMFQNLCGLMQLNFYSGITKDLIVNKIVVEEFQNYPGEGTAFSGTGTVNLSDSNPTLSIGGATSSRSMTLMCGDEDNGVLISEDPETPTPFLIALPPFAFSANDGGSMKVSVFANGYTTGAYVSLKFTGAISVEAGKVSDTKKQLLPYIQCGTSGDAEISGTSAILKGSVSAFDGGANITEIGVMYKKKTQSDDYYEIIPTGYEAGPISYKLEGLENSTDYAYCIYAKGHYRDAQAGEFFVQGAMNIFHIGID